MVGAGKFKNRINTKNEFISETLEQSPLTGPVGEADYKNFVTQFKLAFPDGVAGIAIASRLLAMKRTDYFVWVVKVVPNYVGTLEFLQM